MAREVVLTPDGKERIEQELDRLRGPGREDVAEHLRRALESGGDLIDNAEYLAAKDEQAKLERRIATLERRLEDALVVERAAVDGHVDVGAHVRLRDRDERQTEEYLIVGSGEGDPPAGRISRDSPLGQAVLGRARGDLVELETPSGTRRLEILAVS